MPGSLEAVVGLGNPGSRYEGTRHNAGFWFADGLARQCGARFKADNRAQGELARLDAWERPLWLLKPHTWMNDSGRSVASLAHYYRLKPDGLLIAYDDLDLPPGTVRLKQGGGHGGHNGLRDITSALNSTDFPRLRIGIGHPGHKDMVTPWVLSRPAPDDRAAILDGIERALAVMPLVAAGDWPEAVKRLHTREGGDGRGETGDGRRETGGEGPQS